MSEVPLSKGPIRRDPRLHGLSHEHHVGLIVAWRLKQGVKRRATDIQMVQYISYHWEAWLHAHLQLEENLLLIHLPAQHALRIRTLNEHNQLKEIYFRLQEDAALELVGSFADLLYNHIRFEERVLYPFAEKTLNSAQLEVIKNELDGIPEFCAQWTNLFWQE